MGLQISKILSIPNHTKIFLKLDQGHIQIFTPFNTDDSQFEAA